MATKICFIKSDIKIYDEKIVEFTYIKGLAFSQKQKNVLSFHKSINKYFQSDKILEVSTKSNNEIGVKCSAFNLKYKGIPLECVFQSSKVFDGGVQFNVLNMHPKDAKHYIQQAEHGELTGFIFNNYSFPLFPHSFFYDYLYCLCLKESEIDLNKIKGFKIFTDIEFNEKKQYNCQARSLCIAAALFERGLFDDALESPENFKRIVYSTCSKKEQLSLL